MYTHTHTRYTIVYTDCLLAEDCVPSNCLPHPEYKIYQRLLLDKCLIEKSILLVYYIAYCTFVHLWAWELRYTAGH